jgi:hypothetical protein
VRYRSLRGSTGSLKLAMKSLRKTHKANGKFFLGIRCLPYVAFYFRILKSRDVCWVCTEPAGILVALQTRIRELLHSYLGWDIGYPETFRGSPQFLYVNPGSASIKSWPLPSKSFPVPLSSYCPSIYSLFTASLIN